MFVVEETTLKEKVVKCGPGSPQGVAEGSGAAVRASYLPTPRSRRGCSPLDEAGLQ